MKNQGANTVLAAAIFLAACSSTSQKRPEIGEVEDFSISSEASNDEDSERNYLRELKGSIAAIEFKGSFPLPISVGKSASPFETLPKPALAPKPAKIEIMLGPCRLIIAANDFQVDRYLYTGDWVRFGREHRAGHIMPVEPSSDLNLRVRSQLSVEVPESEHKICRMALEGRVFILGGFHIDESASKIYVNKSLSVDMNVFLADRRIQATYLRWLKGDDKPSLNNDLGFPATVESPMYRVQFGKAGFYYLGFNPQLGLIRGDKSVKIIRQKVVADIQ